MRPSPSPSPTQGGRTISTFRSGLTFCLALLILALLAVILAQIILAYREATRGVEPTPAGHMPRLGANVDVLGVTDTERAQQLEAAHNAGLTHIRQRVAWAAIEPEPGDFRWVATDRLIEAAQAQGLGVVAVLVDAPGWARAASEQNAPLSPPADPATYARFVGAFVHRYEGRLMAVQLWDSPNLAARSVGEFIPARQYVALLRAAYPLAKAADPRVVVLGGGLAATVENSTRNQTDVQYLEWLYRAGARGYFDALAAKPYGFWSGPDDRRLGIEVLNFSRAVLLRETMIRYGDAATPMWAVEWGWNALPADWTGRPSPWGTDTVETQAARTGEALLRARAEWPWLQAMTLMHLRPTARTDDPVWGFALLDEAGQPRPALQALNAATTTPAPMPPDTTPWPTFGLWVGLVVGGVVVGWQGARAAGQLPWGAAWGWWDTSLDRLGERGNMGLMAGVIGGFALLPFPFNLACLLPLPLLLARRLDLALAAIVLSAPFFLKPVRLGGASVALVEALTLLTFGAWVIRAMAQTPPPTPPLQREGGSRGEVTSPLPPPPSPRRWEEERGLGPDPSSNLSLTKGGEAERDVSAPLSMAGKGAGGVGLRLHHLIRRLLPLNLLDLSVLLLLILGAVSPLVALLPGVATREFRVVILEPILFYFVLRNTRLDERGLLRLADALALAGVGLALWGFLTFDAAGGIAAEGVRRLRSVYGSPNNLALTLGRIIPLLLVLLIWGQSRLRRLGYGLALVPITIALFMTFSTGAWLLGVPSALLFLGVVQGRRVLLAVLGVLSAGLLALLPFATTERVGRLLRLGEAQTLEWRRWLWQSSLDMIRDRPWFGVGLDNFLYEYRDTYILPQALADRNLSHPHNLILDFWTRLGVFAVVSLVMGQVAFFRAAYRLWRGLEGDRRLLVLGLSASMVNFLAHGLIDNSLFLVDLAFIYMLTVGVVRNLELSL